MEANTIIRLTNQIGALETPIDLNAKCMVSMVTRLLIAGTSSIRNASSISFNNSNQGSMFVMITTVLPLTSVGTQILMHQTMLHLMLTTLFTKAPTQVLIRSMLVMEQFCKLITLDPLLSLLRLTLKLLL